MSLLQKVARAQFQKANPRYPTLSQLSKISNFRNSRYSAGKKILAAMRRWNTVKKARHNMRKRAAAKQLAWARKRYHYGPKYGKGSRYKAIHSVRMKRV